MEDLCLHIHLMCVVVIKAVMIIVVAEMQPQQGAASVTIIGINI